ncbi:helix-turn-helix domain-containing protein [Promicromonospora sp. NPDC050249]|uniref:winged helix-turn-helix transcriptional regulator n=1 Tax=Promicromonospora sp. NPDC050249 TaxID=3154743 RepID=UPI00340A083F
MAPSRSPELDPQRPYCSIERALIVLTDRWAFLVMREALLYDVERFADFRERLDIATNILTNRLDRLVQAGVLERTEYREPGSRTRPAYRPTPAGRDLTVVLGALQQWGDEHVPREDGPTMTRREQGSAAPLRVDFVRDDGPSVPLDRVEFARV